MQNNINLLDFCQQSMKDWLIEIGQPGFRAQQLINWLHQQFVDNFDEMLNLPKPFRTWLKENARIHQLPIMHEHISQDGTIKWLLGVDAANAVEMVYIPESTRGTLCISSQVGCALDCSFCSTGKQGFNRNLTSGEIIGQLRLANTRLKDLYPSRLKPITNVVMMGMGEPLANEKHVTEALRLMIDDHAYGLAYRRVTVSTSGMVPAMLRLKENLPNIAMAVSLHAPNDTLRNELVPINQKYPLSKLMAVCAKYYEGQKKRQITYEYVMLKGVNDSLEHAKELSQLLRQAPGKINLIPFNPFKNSPYKTSDRAQILAFQQYLRDDYVTTIRTTRGDDISAACGQLVGDVADKTRRIKIHQEP
jgi:23S rRNA (adenine2503-C2)-methyltransferase